MNNKIKAKEDQPKKYTDHMNIIRDTTQQSRRIFCYKNGFIVCNVYLFMINGWLRWLVSQIWGGIKTVEVDLRLDMKRLNKGSVLESVTRRFCNGCRKKLRRKHQPADEAEGERMNKMLLLGLMDLILGFLRPKYLENFS